MLSGLYPLQQIIVQIIVFFEPLMDDKNPIITAQDAGVLFTLQILDSTYTLLHQHC